MFWPDKVVGGSLDKRNKAVLLAAGGLLPEHLHGVPPWHTVHHHVVREASDSPHPPEGSHFIISRVREIFNVEGLDQVVDRVTFIRKEVVIKPLENFIQS